MVCSKEFEEKCSLKEKVEDNLTVDLFNQLDDNEADIEKIARQTFKICGRLQKKQPNMSLKSVRQTEKHSTQKNKKRIKLKLKRDFFKRKIKIIKRIFGKSNLNLNLFVFFLSGISSKIIRYQ